MLPMAAPRVGVLDDHTSRSFETADGFPSGVRVSDIVVGKFFALMLMETGEQARSHNVFAVKGCLFGADFRRSAYPEP